MSREVSLRVLPRGESPSTKKGRAQTRALGEHKPGCRLRIMAIQLEALRKDALYPLGLVEGRVLNLVHNDFKGRLVVEMEGRPVILGFQESRRILVRSVV